MHRQCSARSHRTGTNTRCCSGGIHQSCCFTDNSTNCQNDTGQNSRHGTWYDNLEYCPQSACSQTEAALPERIRNTHQCFFGCPHNQRQYHQCQCNCTAQQRISKVAGNDKHQVTKQTKDNGRNPLQGFCGHPHHFYQLVASFCIFHEVNCRTDTDRNCHNQGQYHHFQRVNNGRHHGIIRCGIFPCEHLRTDCRNAFH